MTRLGADAVARNLGAEALGHASIGVSSAIRSTNGVVHARAHASVAAAVAAGLLAGALICNADALGLGGALVGVGATVGTANLLRASAVVVAVVSVVIGLTFTAVGKC